MKTKKEQVFDFLRIHTLHASDSGVVKHGLTTQHIAKELSMQRANVSSILNKLVAEGQVSKSDGRPVRFYVTRLQHADTYGCFINMTGHKGSLQQTVSQAKAAILYPDASQNVLIVGEKGTGKKFLVELMHEYAVEQGVIPTDSILKKYDCFEYLSTDAAHNEDENIIDLQDTILSASNIGIITISDVHLLSNKSRRILLNQISVLRQGEKTQSNNLIIAVTCDVSNTVAINDFSSKFETVINIPALALRPLNERMELICRQFTLEAARAKKTFKINAELLRCLLLYNCALNIEQLKSDIKLGCANAYVREFKNKGDCINVYVSDFEHYVRKGFVNYSKYRGQIEEIIPLNYEYSFNESNMEMLSRDRRRVTGSVSIYETLSHKANELELSGFSEDDVSEVLGVELERTFSAYHKSIIKQISDTRQLSLLVEDKIISLVTDFLEHVSEKLQRKFPTSVFFGLCLHISAMLNAVDQTHKVPLQQVNDIIENQKTEYLLCVQFAAKLQQEYGVTIPINEVALITMFICSPKYSDHENEGSAILLYMFQGTDVAKALAGAINELTGNNNAYYVEITSDKDLSELYADVKKHLESIDNGQGIVIFYDAEFLEPMLDIIYEEIVIPIRRVYYPVVSSALNHSHIAASGKGIDDIFKEIMADGSTLRIKRNKKAIITLCSSGRGGAEQIRDYLLRYGQINNYDVIPLAMVGNEPLQREVMDIMKDWSIHCFVGTHNPNLFSIPFISLSSVFSVKPEELPSLLRLETKERERIDFDEVYTYLEEQLKMVDMDKLKKTLPAVLEEISKNIGFLSLDAEIGLFMHIACYINRVLSKEHPVENLRKDMIISKYTAQYKKLLQVLKPIERKFNIIISDDEAAHVLAIINKV